MTFMPNADEPLGDQDADPAEADDADGLLVELDAGVLRPLPLAVAQRGVRRADVAGGGEQQGDGELGGADDVGGRRVDDHDAGLGGGPDVDVVEADAGAGDDLEAAWRRPAPRRRPWWRERTRIASTSAIAGSSSARSAPLQCRISKSGPSASTVAGLSSSAMSTTGLLTAVSSRPGRGGWQCTTLCGTSTIYLEHHAVIRSCPRHAGAARSSARRRTSPATP